MEPGRQKASEKGKQAKDPHWNEKFQKGEGPFILCKDFFFFFSVILNHSSPVKPNINVTTTGILSEKLKATGENKGWIEENKIAGGGEFSNVGLDWQLYGLKFLGNCNWI